MKLFLSPLSRATICCGLAFLPALLSAAPDAYAVRRPPSKAVISISVTPPRTIGLFPLAALPGTIAPSSAEWVNIKDYPYAQRAALLAGLPGMEARVDAQIAELNARRTAMTATTRTADWDFAMQEMLNARAYLRAMGRDLGQATPETWEQQRERVSQAWVRTQNAYGRVKASTTS